MWFFLGFILACFFFKLGWYFFGFVLASFGRIFLGCRGRDFVLRRFVGVLVG